MDFCFHWTSEPGMTLKKNRNWGLFLNGPDENRAIKEIRFKFAVFIRSTQRRFSPEFIENTF